MATLGRSAIALAMLLSSAVVAGAQGASAGAATADACVLSERSLPSGFFGVSGEGFRDASTSAAWNDTSHLAPALAGLNAGTFRLFGGSTANYFDWSTGAFDASGTSAMGIVAGGPPHPISLATWAADIGAGTDHALPTVVDLNLMTTTSGASGLDLAHELQLLSAARTEGIPITGVELGNELYVSATGTPNLFATGTGPSTYGSDVNDLLSQIHAALPGVPVAIDGEPSRMTSVEGVNGSWDAQVAAALDPSVPASDTPVILHAYWPSGQTNGAPLNMPALWQGEEAAYAGLDNQIATDPLIAGRQVWLTEFNMKADSTAANGSPGLWTGADGTWGQALSDAAYALHLASDPRVSMAIADSAVNANAYGLLLPRGPSYPMTAAGISLSSLFAAAQGAAAVGSLAFPNLPPSSGLVGDEFARGSTISAVIVNASAASETVTLPAFAGAPETSLTPAGGDPSQLPLGTAGTAGSVASTGSAVGNDGTLALAPYSTTTIGPVPGSLPAGPSWTLTPGNLSAQLSVSPGGLCSQVLFVSAKATPSTGTSPSCSAVGTSCTLTGLTDGRRYIVTAGVTLEGPDQRDALSTTTLPLTAGAAPTSSHVNALTDDATGTTTFTLVPGSGDPATSTTCELGGASGNDSAPASNPSTCTVTGAANGIAAGSITSANAFGATTTTTSPVWTYPAGSGLITPVTPNTVCQCTLTGSIAKLISVTGSPTTSIPATAAAVLVTATAHSPTPAWISFYGGGTWPGTSALDLPAGAPRTVTLLVPTDGLGHISALSSPHSTVALSLTVNGYVEASGGNLNLSSLPSRATSVTLAPGAHTFVNVGPVGTSGAMVVAHVTGPTGRGWVGLTAGGQPTVASVTVASAAVTSAAALTQVDPSTGDVTVWNQTSGSLDVTLDIYGRLTTDTGSTGQLRLGAPTIVVNSLAHLDLAGPVAPGATVRITASAGLPEGADVAYLELTLVSTNGSGTVDVVPPNDPGHPVAAIHLAGATSTGLVAVPVHEGSFLLTNGSSTPLGVVAATVGSNLG